MDFSSVNLCSPFLSPHKFLISKVSGYSEIHYLTRNVKKKASSCIVLSLLLVLFDRLFFPLGKQPSFLYCLSFCRTLVVPQLPLSGWLLCVHFFKEGILAIYLPHTFASVPCTFDIKRQCQGVRQNLCMVFKCRSLVTWWIDINNVSLFPQFQIITRI